MEEERKIFHIPVLLKESIEILKVKKNKNYIDATVGLGGHSSEILKLNAPDGKLLAIDWNKESLEEAKRNLIFSFGEGEVNKRVVFVEENFAKIREITKSLNFDSVAGVLADLGISSFLLEKSKRGFSFQRDEILDMRFSKDNKLRAYEILNLRGKRELKEIFQKYGEFNEQEANKIADLVVSKRREELIVSTKDLLSVVFEIEGGRFPRKKLARLFQALRIVVNSELDNLKIFLEEAYEVLERGGRLVVISFHSLEDRIVKNYFKQLAIKKRGRIITKKPVTPSFEETKKNPKARSAKLRAIEKI